MTANKSNCPKCQSPGYNHQPIEQKDRNEFSVPFECQACGHTWTATMTHDELEMS